MEGKRHAADPTRAHTPRETVAEMHQPGVPGHLCSIHNREPLGAGRAPCPSSPRLGVVCPEFQWLLSHLMSSCSLVQPHMFLSPPVFSRKHSEHSFNPESQAQNRQLTHVGLACPSPPAPGCHEHLPGRPCPPPAAPHSGGKSVGPISFSQRHLSRRPAAWAHTAPARTSRPPVPRGPPTPQV